MKGQFKAYILIVFLVLVTQQNATAGLKLKIHSYDVSQFPSIRIFLTVGKDGAAIKSPILSQFKAAMEDKEALALKQVSTLKKSGENIALLLAVDTSGSMKKKQILAIKGAIKKLMEQKAPQDLVGLLSFNDDVFEDCDFTENADIFLKKLDALHCRGKSTVLFKAVFTGLEMLERPDLPRLRYLVVLSDGKDEGVGFTLDDAIANAKKFNACLSGWHIRPTSRCLGWMLTFGAVLMTFHSLPVSPNPTVLRGASAPMRPRTDLHTLVPRPPSRYPTPSGTRSSGRSAG